MSDKQLLNIDSKTKRWAAVIGLAWLGLAEVILFVALGDREAALQVSRWLIGSWALTLLDLFAIAGVMGAILNIKAVTDEKRYAALFQAFYWAFVKLTCIGLLIVVLIKAATQAIPGVELSLILGIGTLVVVPLVGGFIWSLRILRHAPRV